VIPALSIFAIGAGLIFAAAFAVLAATPLANEDTGSRFTSPAMARLRASAGSAVGIPEPRGFVDGLVRALMSARATIQGRHRDVTP